MTSVKRSTATNTFSLQRAKRQKRHDPVKRANALEAEDFEEQFFGRPEEHHVLQRVYTIMHYTLAALPSEDLDQCLDLIEQTSQQDYAASTIGWNVPQKRKEMNDSSMHYLIVREQCEDNDPTPSAPLPAFCSFMLTYDSSPTVPVLYIYEIHLTKDLRRSGLGTKLISICERVAQAVGVNKVMLTCFISNVNARRFYERLGFEKDVVSPEARQIRNKTVEVDILILSKAIHPRVHDDTSSEAK